MLPSAQRARAFFARTKELFRAQADLGSGLSASIDQVSAQFGEHGGSSSSSSSRGGLSEGMPLALHTLDWLPGQALELFTEISDVSRHFYATLNRLGSTAHDAQAISRVERLLDKLDALALTATETLGRFRGAAAAAAAAGGAEVGSHRAANSPSRRCELLCSDLAAPAKRCRAVWKTYCDLLEKEKNVAAV
jgi:hypothetical protein